MNTSRTIRYAEIMGELLREDPEPGDLAWYRQVVADAPDGDICDLGCGIGRVALTVARAGHVVDAVDIRAAALDRMLERISPEPERIQQRIRPHEADMRAFGADDAYAVVLLCNRALQTMLTVQDRHQVLWNAWRILQDGGVLALDVAAPDVAALRRASGDAEGAWHDVGRALLDDDHALTLSHATRYDLLHKLVHTDLRWIEEGPQGTRLTEERLVQGFVFRDELVLHLELAGFAVEAIRGDFHDGLLEQEGQDIVVVARKVG